MESSSLLKRHLRFIWDNGYLYGIPDEIDEIKGICS